MYFVIIALTMLVLPVTSVIVDSSHHSASFITLIGKWFVFWAVGVRLAIAGVRQTLRPEFTLRDIFRMQGSEAAPLVRELGVSNLAIGVIGLLSLLKPSFVLPVAIYAAIFYGAAGIMHLYRRAPSANEVAAMVSDIFICLVLSVFAILSL